MTPKQGEMYIAMLNGGYIIQVRNTKGHRQYKLMTGNQIPVMWLKDSDMKVLDFMTRWRDKEKTTMVLDLRAIRKLHGKTLFKSLYKLHRGKQKTVNSSGLPA